MFYRFKPNEGVIVIGATNFAEALDKYVVVSCFSFTLCFTQSFSVDFVDCGTLVQDSYQT